MLLVFWDRQSCYSLIVPIDSPFSTPFCMQARDSIEGYCNLCFRVNLHISIVLMTFLVHWDNRLFDNCMCGQVACCGTVIEHVKSCSRSNCCRVLMSLSIRNMYTTFTSSFLEHLGIINLQSRRDFTRSATTCTRSRLTYSTFSTS